MSLLLMKQWYNVDFFLTLFSTDLREMITWFCANSALIYFNRTKLLQLGTRQMLSGLPDDFSVILLGK